MTAELLGLPPEERFMYFARGLDRILDELTQRGLADTIASAEIFNEVDGGIFTGLRPLDDVPVAELHMFRNWHEEALEFLKTRHPGMRFALDTYTPWTSADLAPRNP